MIHTSGAPGTFVWLLCSSPDIGAATAFYSRLFGWLTQPSPVGLLVSTRGGQLFGTLMAHVPVGRGDNPLGWLPFVRVADVDVSLERAVKAEGSILVPPQTVASVRAAVITGATGELIGLWQSPLEDGGKPLIGDLSSCAWFELATPKPERAAAFYRALFGWRITSEGGYTFVGNESGQFGGVVELAGDWEDHTFLTAIGYVRGDRRNIPPHWMVFFATDDCDVLADRAESLGATVTGRPEPLHLMGTFAVVRCPDGAYFSVLSHKA